MSESLCLGFTWIGPQIVVVCSTCLGLFLFLFGCFCCCFFCCFLCVFFFGGGGGLFLFAMLCFVVGDFVCFVGLFCFVFVSFFKFKITIYRALIAVISEQ